MKIGILADLHGDLTGFQQALKIFEREQVEQTLCAGDIVDRGADADTIVKILSEQRIPAIKGNHEHSIIHNQEQWRKSEKTERLTELGRIISDETMAFLQNLPDSLQLGLDGLRITLGHGTPWSDVLGIFPDTRQGIFDQLFQRYGNSTDVMVLGHTHSPLHIQIGHMQIVNPGSVYGVTIRDSHTYGIFETSTREFQVFSLKTGEKVEIPFLNRTPQGKAVP